MTTRTKLTPLIVIFACIVLAIALGQLQQHRAPKNTQSPQDQWETLSSSTYKLRHPKEATGEVRPDESVIYFMGQKQISSGRIQTELFDGYSFRMSTITLEEGTNLEQFAAAAQESARNDCTEQEKGIVSQIQKVTIDKQPGFQYSAKNCRTDFTETFVSFNDKAYRISQLYVGDDQDQKGYQDTTNNILGSLQFIQKQTEQPSASPMDTPSPAAWPALPF